MIEVVGTVCSGSWIVVAAVGSALVSLFVISVVPPVR